MPVILPRQDVLSTAQTGTAKTANFRLALLQRLLTTPAPPNPRLHRVRTLILVPTLELVLKVGEGTRLYGARGLVEEHDCFRSRRHGTAA